MDTTAVAAASLAAASLAAASLAAASLAAAREGGQEEGFEEEPSLGQLLHNTREDHGFRQCAGFASVLVSSGCWFRQRRGMRRIGLESERAYLARAAEAIEKSVDCNHIGLETVLRHLL